MPVFERKWLIQFRKGKYNYGISRIGTEYTNLGVVEDTLSLGYPLTMSCSISRNLFDKVMSASIAIKGLNKTSRAWLRKDQYDREEYITFDLYGGYGDKLYLMFIGEVRTCYSYKNGGETEYTTALNAFSGFEAWQKGFSSVTFTKRADKNTIIDTLMSQVPHVKRGCISPELVNENSSRGQTFLGNTFELISTYLGDKNFIDLGYMHALNDDDCIPSETFSIDASNRLTGTPKRTKAWIECPLLFDPRVKIGQFCLLNSETDPALNGGYKVWGIQHTGTFSGAVDSRVVTTLTLNFALERFRVLPNY